MFGLAILFVLFLWLILTLLATYCGYKIAHKYNHGKLGAFIGFMLLMGGWLVYWTVEYFYIQAKVKHLCETQGGVTVYVTPEEWRKMIGEEEWNRLSEYSNIQKQDYPKDKIIYNQSTYIPTVIFNKRLVQYNHSKEIGQYIGGMNAVIIDIKYQKPIIHYTYFTSGAGSWLAGGSVKGWLNNTKDCSAYIRQQFKPIIKLYSNTQQENKL